MDTIDESINEQYYNWNVNEMREYFKTLDPDEVYQLMALKKRSRDALNEAIKLCNMKIAKARKNAMEAVNNKSYAEQVMCESEIRHLEAEKAKLEKEEKIYRVESCAAFLHIMETEYPDHMLSELQMSEYPLYAWEIIDDFQKEQGYLNDSKDKNNTAGEKV